MHTKASNLCERSSTPSYWRLAQPHRLGRLFGNPETSSVLVQVVCKASPIAAWAKAPLHCYPLGHSSMPHISAVCILGKVSLSSCAASCGSKVWAVEADHKDLKTAQPFLDFQDYIRHAAAGKSGKKSIIVHQGLRHSLFVGQTI